MVPPVTVEMWSKFEVNSTYDCTAKFHQLLENLYPLTYANYDKVS